MKEYIHYGDKSFNPNKFEAIRNEYLWVKPMGGLWASPVDAEWGWKDWCEINKFRECNEENSFKFTLTKGANVYHIYGVNDLENLPRQELPPELYTSSRKYILDFECMVNSGYDAIELHLSEDRYDEVPGQYQVMNGLYYALYGWDCDSILIMNPDIIIPV